MDWSLERSRLALRHIVALLFLFATLAERAAKLPRPARSRMLGILLQAEARACEFINGQGDDDIPPLAHYDDADEAARLALSFRALAIALTCLDLFMPRESPRETLAHRIAAHPALRTTPRVERTGTARQRAPPRISRACAA